MNKLEEKTILINDINKEDHKELVEKINKLNTTKIQIHELENNIIKLEEEIASSGFKVIGVKEANLRVTITPAKLWEELNYAKTIENVEDKEKYLKKIDKLTTTYEFDKQSIEEDLKDRLVYDTKTKKSVVAFRDLVKEEIE